MLFFSNRLKFVAESLNKKDLIGLANIFKISHAGSLSKSAIENIHEDLPVIISHLKVTKRELENNLLYNVSELIRAELFTNFLESAKYLSIESPYY